MRRRKRRASVEHSVYDVFTPTTQARLNFVDRQSVNDQFVDALETPGKQVVVFGESGSGKSTLLQKKLEELYPHHITTQCSASSTFPSVLLDAFDKLNPFYLEGYDSRRDRTLKGGAVAEFSKIRATVDASFSSGTTENQRRALPPQLTPQRLGEFMGELGLCWVVEDFHKVPESEKVYLAQAFKVFSDLASQWRQVKIIAVGAVGTARQVVAYDPEMSNRVSELGIPLMTEGEILAILDGGESLLKVNLDSVKQQVAEFSVGVPSICHQLALNLCVEADVYSTQPRTVSIDEKHLENATQRYVRESSDTLKSTFERALRRHKVRKYDNCRIILQALASGPTEGMMHNEILAIVRRTYDKYNAGNVTTYLNQLTSADRGAPIRQAPDGRYRFVDPLHHTFASALLGPPPKRKSLVANVVFSEFKLTIDAFRETGGFTWYDDLNTTTGLVYQQLGGVILGGASGPLQRPDESAPFADVVAYKPPTQMFASFPDADDGSEEAVPHPAPDAAPEDEDRSSH